MLPRETPRTGKQTTHRPRTGHAPATHRPRTGRLAFPGATSAPIWYYKSIAQKRFGAFDTLHGCLGDGRCWQSNSRSTQRLFANSLRIPRTSLEASWAFLNIFACSMNMLNCLTLGRGVGREPEPSLKWSAHRFELSRKKSAQYMGSHCPRQNT